MICAQCQKNEAQLQALQDLFKPDYIDFRIASIVIALSEVMASDFFRDHADGMPLLTVTQEQMQGYMALTMDAFWMMLIANNKLAKNPEAPK